jgi:serine/threonine protein kinase
MSINSINYSNNYAAESQTIETGAHEEVFQENGGLTESPSNLRRYTLKTQPIGAGAFGQVFAGTDRTGSPVAVKKMKYTDQAHKEVNALKTVQADNAVGYRGFIVLESNEPHNCCIVMDRAPGENLHKIINTRFVPISESISITKQLLEFLNCMRRHRLSHRDIKFANIMWDRASRVITVVDFAGMRQIDENFSGSCLTLQNQAPECILGMKECPDYDLWSTALVIYGLFTSLDLFVIPNAIEQKNKNAFLMQLISDQLGFPTSEFLKRCRLTSNFFNKHGNFKKKWLIPKSLHWKNVLNTKLSEHASPETAADITDLLDKLLRYENRVDPQVLLSESRLLRKELTIHLKRDEGQLRLQLHRKSELSHPSLCDASIDLKTHKRSLVHVPRDINDEYIVSVENSLGSTTSRKTVRLDELDTLDIQDL